MKTLLYAAILSLAMIVGGCGPDELQCPGDDPAPNLERMIGEAFMEARFSLKDGDGEPIHPYAQMYIKRRIEVLSDSRISVTYEHDGEFFEEIYEVTGSVWQQAN